MTNIGLLFFICSICLISTDAVPLRSKLDELIAKIEAYTTTVTNFEKSVLNSKSKLDTFIKNNMTEAWVSFKNYDKTIDDAETKLNSFTHVLCHKEEKDFKSYDCNKTITAALETENGTYNTLIKGISDLVQMYKNEADATKTDANACTDDGCIDVVSGKFDNIKSKYDDLTDSNNQKFLEEDKKYNNLVSDTVKTEKKNIETKANVVTTCLTNLAEDKIKLDKQLTDLKPVRDSAVAKIADKKSTSDKSVDTSISQYKTSLKAQVDKSKTDLKPHEDEASKKKADIKTCTDMKQEFDQLNKEYSELSDQTADQFKLRSKDVVTKNTNNIETQTVSLVNDLIDQLSKCSTSDCETTVAQKSAKINVKDISSAVADQANLAVNSILAIEKALQDTLQESSHGFEAALYVKSINIVQCIQVGINVADIGTIKGDIFDEITKTGENIRQADSLPLSFEAEWLQNKQNTLSALEKTFNVALENITRKEIEAAKYKLNVTNCSANKSYFYGVLLPKSATEISNNITNFEEGFVKKVKDSITQLEQFYKITQEMTDSVYTCAKTDADCIAKVKQTCDTKIKNIDSKSKDIYDKLSKEYTETSKQLKVKVDAVLKFDEEFVKNSTNTMVKCIDKRIDTDSAMIFAPSLILLLITIFVQSYL